MARIHHPLFASILVVLALGCNDTPSSSDGGADRPDGSAPTSDAAPPVGDDASAPMDDGGSAPPLPGAPTIDIEIAASCESFSPCGGDVVGTWAYTDGCVEADLSDVRDACPAATIEATATASGVVRIDAFTIEREATVRTEARIAVPASCAFLGCAMMADLLASGGDASCTDTSTGGCDCTITRTESDRDFDGYHLDGNTLVTDDGSVYDYCRAGTTIDYAEQGDSSVFELSPL